MEYGCWKKIRYGAAAAQPPLDTATGPCRCSAPAIPDAPASTPPLPPPHTHAHAHTSCCPMTAAVRYAAKQAGHAMRTALRRAARTPAATTTQREVAQRAASHACVVVADTADDAVGAHGDVGARLQGLHLRGRQQQRLRQRQALAVQVLQRPVRHARVVHGLRGRRAGVRRSAHERGKGARGAAWWVGRAANAC